MTIIAIIGMQSTFDTLLDDALVAVRVICIFKRYYLIFVFYCVMLPCLFWLCSEWSAGASLLTFVQRQFVVFSYVLF